jgi:predicted phosphodiesterase
MHCGDSVLQWIAPILAVLIRNARMDNAPEPRAKARALFVRDKSLYVIANGNHRLLNYVLRLLVWQRRTSRRRVDEILVKFVELTPPLFVASPDLRDQARPSLQGIGCAVLHILSYIYLTSPAVQRFTNFVEFNVKRSALNSVNVGMIAPTRPISSAPARYAVLGDIHANLEALTAVLNDAQESRCTHFACVGDVVGYNADPIECLQVIRRIGIPCVKGNHDEYCSTEQPLAGLNPRATAATLWTRQQLPAQDKQWLRDLKYTRLVANFSLVHATLDTPQGWGYVFDSLAAAASFNYQSTSVCFFGHTHLPVAFIRDTTVRSGIFSKFRIERGRKYFVNVGSVGEPRDGNPLAAYVIYDLDEHSIELRRVAYDMAHTDAKVRAAGLPERPKPKGLIPSSRVNSA